MTKVELLSHTPAPERTIASAARLCYSSLDGDQLYKGLSDKEVVKLVKKLREMGHLSTFEHASFTFSIAGVSRVLTHQLVRHRIASYSQRSQRYVNEKNFEYVTPKSIEKNEKALAIYNDFLQQAKDTYRTLSEIVPQEDARYVLPNATETKIIVTMNARSLLHFFEVRCCTRAQLEIRTLANKMLELVKEVAPTVFSIAGPTCVTKGVCNEGDLSCGRIKEFENK
ncbi:MAG: FAD-dependent thymidylate synthase [Clostridia bacterium]